MTKNARSQQSTGKALRQTRDANIACSQVSEVCELLLAELQARRARLRRLLRLLCTEVESVPQRRPPLRSRSKCQNVRLNRIA